MEPEKYRALPHFQDLVSVNPTEAFELSGEGGDQPARHRPHRARSAGASAASSSRRPRRARRRCSSTWARRSPSTIPRCTSSCCSSTSGPRRSRTSAARCRPRSSPRPRTPSSDSHIRLSRLAIERAKRLVEAGRHVVILLDSPHPARPRVSNREMGPGGRTMSGGVDNRALQFPRQFFGAARNCEGSGSLTILATALIETGVADGRGHLPGVQGHREHGADPGPRDRRPAHLPRGRRAEVGHPPRGAARPAGGARQAAPAAARARRPLAGRGRAVPDREAPEDAVERGLPRQPGGAVLDASPMRRFR